MIPEGSCDYQKIQALLTKLSVSHTIIMTHSWEAGQALARDPTKLSLNPGEGFISLSFSLWEKDRSMGKRASHLRRASCSREARFPTA